MQRPASISIGWIYDADDGHSAARLLDDGRWPRNVIRARLHLDDWMPEFAPNSAQRAWFYREPTKWNESCSRYRNELSDSPEAVDRCIAWCRTRAVKLLYCARDQEHNQALCAQLLAALARDGGVE